jgi:hypothetical protein
LPPTAPPPPLLLLLLLFAEEDVVEGGAAADDSLLRLPIEFAVLMLLALISESPAAAPELPAGIFFRAEGGPAAPEFSLADAASLEFFC